MLLAVGCWLLPLASCILRGKSVCKSARQERPDHGDPSSFTTATWHWSWPLSAAGQCHSAQQT